MKKLFMLVSLALMLTACSDVQQNNNISSGTPTPTITPSVLSEEEIALERKVTEGDFELRIFTKKAQYAINEPVDVYVELAYVGELDEIEIGHAMYPVGFGITEHTRDYHFGGEMEQPYIVTLLKRDEPIQFQYKFSGGYSDTDAAEYIEFVESMKDNVLPEGEYTISTYADFKIHGQEPESAYRFNTSISFVVSDEEVSQ